MSRWTTIIVVALAVGALCFFLGMRMGKTQAAKALAASGEVTEEIEETETAQS